MSYQKVKTDEFGRHELLDRSCLLMELVESHLLNHSGLKEDEYDLAAVAFDRLYKLYQLIGSRHFEKG